MGINVKRYKYLHIVIGAGIMGIGGYYMGLNMNGSFSSSCWINGYGWIAVALVIFANWSPAFAILGTFIFGFFNTLRVSGSSLAAAFPGALGWMAAIPSQLYQALPFIITALVLIFSSMKKKKEQRPARRLGLKLLPGGTVTRQRRPGAFCTGPSVAEKGKAFSGGGIRPPQRTRCPLTTGQLARLRAEKCFRPRTRRGRKQIPIYSRL